MSKKKAFSGNTMTLKDFHGGSIPTDLPLPSAPGVVVRPSDRSGYDRTTSWGNPMGRPDHRIRPNSSPATRHLDNKTPFITSSVRIGQNFDEDERTPLDGFSAPRRTIRDESFRVPSRHMELMPESAYAGRVSGRHGSAPVSPLSSGGGYSYSSRVSEAARVGLSSQTSSWNHGQAGLGSNPNVWTSRKEMPYVQELVQSTWSEQSAVSKLAHASALEKVSSGRWQSKQSLLYQKDTNAAKHSEIENGLHSQGYDDKLYSRMNVADGREFSDVTLARHVEKGLSIEDGIHGGRKESPDYERNHSVNYLELKENKSMIHGEGVQPTHSNGKFVSHELHLSPSVLPEASDRPKLKLLPRTRPLLDSPKSPTVDPKQGHQRPSEYVLSYTETGNTSHIHVPASKPILAGGESQFQAVDRPKLNLRPHLHPVERLEGNIEKERKSLFGGARPRELVLKERGIDDSNHEHVQHLDRVNRNVLRTDKAADQAAPRHGERVENHPVDLRGGRKPEINHRVDNGRIDMQRRNWRNENRRNGREPQQASPAMERQPSPETWRKPVEKTKPVSAAQTGGVRYGKVTSAVELAQAFSKSFSNQKTDDQYGGQRGTPGLTQVGFSRLMSPPRRPQINGY